MDDQRANRESSGMKFRKLRIAFSVTCGIACVLLVAIWIESQYFLRSIHGRNTRHYQTARGFFLVYELTAHRPVGWQSSRIDFKDWTPDNVINFPMWGTTDMTNTASEKRVAKIPLWYFASFFAVGAVLPWLPWSNRFSVRTLLITITVVAIGIGLIAWLVRQ
jgi:hypothetical protein